MKKITYLIVFVLITNLSFSQKNIAKVAKVNGIEVYMLNEPLREYEVAFNKQKGLQWSSFLTGGLINASISTKISRYIARLLKESQSTGETFDAILYTNGKNVTAIRFTNPNDKDKAGLATVQKIDNIPMFAMCEPLIAYEEVKKKGGGIKWKSMVTVGLWNNSIEQDLAKFARKFKRYHKKGKIDAIVYRRKKKAYGIKFTSGKNEQVYTFDTEESTNTIDEVATKSINNQPTIDFLINGNWKSSCGSPFTLVMTESENYKELKQFVAGKEIVWKSVSETEFTRADNDNYKLIFNADSKTFTYNTDDGINCTWKK